MKIRRLIFGVVVIALLGMVFLYWSTSSDRPESTEVTDPSLPAVGAESPSPPNSVTTGTGNVQDAHHFSPEMQALVSGIHAGQPVRVQVGGEVQRYLFRSKRITTENFQISSGTATQFPASFEIFEGRQIQADGGLTGAATLAVVNGSVSMAYTTEGGDFLIEENENGELESRTLLSREAGSTWGHFQCDESNGLAGIMDAAGGAAEPPRAEAEITLAAGAETAAEPTVEGARASHPYFRLGSQYDASLKDILILMISSKSRTGTNLSSKAATYFTYAATAADVYERQLGLRYLLQELILIPSNSTEDDIEPAVNDPNDLGSDDLAALEAWCDTHRNQSTYQWGHAMGWTLVDGSGGGWVGWAWLDNYGSSGNAFSVNEPEWTWGVHIHELGHNVGASHTNQGAMDPTVSKSNPKEDFFTENQASGGYTAATDIYNYMSSPSRNYITGPANLRNPVEMPFGVDDTVATAADTALTFNPLSNDEPSTPLFGATNNLRLVEVGQVFPKAAGTATVAGNEITFTPTTGFSGNVWLSYTVGGDVGNGGKGWLHSADVVITVGGSSSDPSQNPAISTTTDEVQTDYSGPIRINPLLNDEGKGRLWAGDVDAINFDVGTAESYSDGAFHLVSAQVISGGNNNNLSYETAEMTRDSSNAQSNTGYLIYTPDGNESSQVVIEYTVEDANGNQSTGTIHLNEAETVGVAADSAFLAEQAGKVATVTFTRNGSVTNSEWVDFFITGSMKLSGSDSDVAIAGYDKLDPVQKTGRITIPAGQSVASLKLSFMDDSIEEGLETVTIQIGAVESLLVDAGADAATVAVSDTGEIYREDFDGFLSDWGDWVDAGPTGSWDANSGGTPSGSTGPNNDHTQGNANGVYLYREASGAGTGSQADLVSPTIDLSGATSPTVEFYYHMYGAAMGDLHVDVYSGGIWIEDVIPVISGQQQANQADPWLKASVDVSGYKTSDFKVRLRSYVGSSFTSDISVDDFLIIDDITFANESLSLVGQPQSQVVDSGGAFYLSVVAQAYPAPTYQWKKGGGNIPGATNSVYFVAAADGADSGDYTCDVTSGTTLTSSTATVSVIAPPVNVTATTGDGDITLNWDDISAGNFDSFSVFRSTTSGEVGTALDTDIATSSYTDTNVTAGTTYYYVVRAIYDGPIESDNSVEVSIAARLNTAAPVVDAGADQTVLLQGGTPVPVTTGAAISLVAGVGLDDGQDATWEDNDGLWSLPLDTANGVSFGASGSGLPALSFAYDFPGGLSGQGGGEGASMRDQNVNNDPVTIEIWFKPDASASYPSRGQVLWETGGGTGLGIFYKDGFVEVAHDSDQDRISADVSSLTGEFIQAVVTFDTGGSTDNYKLYINGSLQITSSRSDTDISGSDAAGLGERGGSNVGGAGNGDSNTTSFDGKIAIFRAWHDRVLTDAEVADNYNSVAGGVAATVTLDGTVTDADGDTPTTTWTKVSGPGLVNFDDASAIDTTATITQVGTYVLQLTADDGLLQTSDQITLTITDGADADTDGMDDQWENTYFGGLGQPADGDFDGDGVANILERAFGTLPNDSSSANLPTPEMVDEGGTDYLSITYRRLKGGTGTSGVDYTVEGLIYTVEYDIDLTDPWSSGSVVQVGSASDNGDGTETVTVRLSSAVSSETKQFIRVKVTATP